MSSYSENQIINYILDNIFIPEIRQARYLDDELKDLIQDKCTRQQKHFITGSCGEGVQNANDRDVMTMLPGFLVVESPDHIPPEYEHCVLLLDQIDCINSSFARLKLYRKSLRPVIKEDRYFTYHEGEYYLDRLKLLKHANAHYKKYIYGDNNMEAPTHGPALLVQEIEDKDMDFVPCFKMPTWPTFSDLLDRGRQSPSSETMKRITAGGCHLVPVPHPRSSKPELEFRISFSIPEKLMVRTWTTKQMKLYYLCKELFNLSFKEEGNDMLEKGLCSYFAKTIIFWMVEENVDLYWEQRSLLDILEDFFGILSNHLSNRSCPNYFIPKAHLMENYTERQIEQLQEVIKSVRAELFIHTLRSHSLTTYIRTFLGMKRDRVVSSCKKVFKEGDPEKISDLVESICNDNFFCLPNGVKMKDVVSWQLMKMIIGQFMIFCQADDWSYEQKYGGNPVEVLLNVSSILYARFTPLYGHELCSFFYCAMMRSIAYSLMERTYRLRLSISNSEFWENVDRAESYMLLAYRFNGILDDHNISGMVSLGLLNKWAGRKQKAKEHFVRAAHQWAKFYDEYSRKVMLLRMPIVLTGKYGQPPLMFLPDPFIRKLFVKHHMHQIDFDPIVLALYQMITLGERDAIECFRDLGANLPYLQVVQLDDKSSIMTTTIDSYQFLKYMLGLMGTNDVFYERCSKEYDRVCSQCEEIQLFMNDDHYAVDSSTTW